MSKRFKILQKETYEAQEIQIKNYKKSGGYTLGPWMTHIINTDPKHLSFTLARYKFVSKMLKEKNVIAEIGCGDAFGSMIVAFNKTRFYGIDVEKFIIKDNIKRIKCDNIKFVCQDIIEKPLKYNYDAAFSLDVIEHIAPNDTELFINNLKKPLNKNGLLIIGCPNIHASDHASDLAKMSHINLQSCESLSKILKNHFEEVLNFVMNDEVVHTGFSKMGHYVFAIGVIPKK